MAAPSFVSAGTLGAGAASVTINPPGNASQSTSTFLVCAVMTANEALPGDADWTQFGNSPIGQGTAGAANAVRLQAYYKWGAGTGTAADDAFTTGDSGNVQAGVIFSFSGVHPTAPVDITASSAQAASTTITWPAVTTTQADCLILNLSALDRDFNSSDTVQSLTNANLTSLTERFDQTVNTNTGGGIYLATGVKAAAGDTGSTTGTTVSLPNSHLTIALAPGSQTLTPPLFTNSQTFYDPTVSVGAVTLVPNLFTNTQTFYAPTLAQGSQELTPSLFTNTQTFYAPAVTPGPVDLSPSLFTNSQSFHAPTVSPGAVSLTPGLFTNSQAFYDVTVTVGAVTLSPSLFTNDQTFYSPTVAPAAIALECGALVNEQTFYAATLERAWGSGDVPPSSPDWSASAATGAAWSGGSSTSVTWTSIPPSDASWTP